MDPKTFRKIFITVYCVFVLGLSTIFCIRLMDQGSSMAEGIFLSLLGSVMLTLWAFIPLWWFLEKRLIKRRARKDRDKGPYVTYNYSNFDDAPLAIVERVEEYGEYNDPEYSYNLIDKKTGHRALPSWVDDIYPLAIPFVHAFLVSYNKGLWNVVYTDKHNTSGVNFMLEKPAKHISNFDTEGYAIVTTEEGYVTYVRYDGKKLFPTLLKSHGEPRTEN